MSVQALAPKLESMEAAWAGLHTLTGADTPEEIIAFLKGAVAARACSRSWLKFHLRWSVMSDYHGSHQTCTICGRNAFQVPQVARSLSSLQTVNSICAGCLFS